MTSWRRLFQRGVGGDGDDIRAAASSPRAPPCRRTPPRIGSACGPLPRSILLRCRRRSGPRCSPRAWALPRAILASSVRSISDWKKRSMAHEGPGEQREHAQHRHQRQQPARRGAAVQKLRQREGHRHHREPDDQPGLPEDAALSTAGRRRTRRRTGSPSQTSSECLISEKAPAPCSVSGRSCLPAFP